MNTSGENIWSQAPTPADLPQGAKRRPSKGSNNWVDLWIVFGLCLVSQWPLLCGYFVSIMGYFGVTSFRLIGFAGIVYVQGRCSLSSWGSYLSCCSLWRASGASSSCLLRELREPTIGASEYSGPMFRQYSCSSRYLKYARN